MPAPVRSRSCLTASAVIVIVDSSSSWDCGRDQPRRGPPPPPRPRRPVGALPVPVRERPALAVVLRGALRPYRRTRRRSASSGSAATLATTGRRPRVLGVRRTAAAHRRRRLRRRRPRAPFFFGLPFSSSSTNSSSPTDHRGSLRPAFDDRIGDARGIQRDGAHGVVVARNHVVDVVRRAVGIDHRDHRDAELLGLEDRDLFVAHVDDEDDVRRRFHLLDAAQALLELVLLTAHHRGFFLATLAERAVLRHLGEIHESLDRPADGLEIGEHAAQPALVHVGHLAALGFLLHGLARRALGADEQHLAAVADHAASRSSQLPRTSAASSRG